MVTSSVSRRQRLRQQTLEEIHAVALQQVADGGAEAVSLNAIAKAMGMSGPGLYRYYASRDDLLAALVAAGYDRLAAALQVAVHAADGLPAEEQLGRVLHAYRDWAVANPRYYQLIDAFRRRTGVPVLLNTSFNENEPIVQRPEEALDCFLRTDMDVLVMGSHVLDKRPA